MSNTIMTKCGEIRGTTCQWDGVTAYKGIRYATAGRWEYPIPVTHWDGVYEATAYGNCSYQPRAFYNEEEVVENPAPVEEEAETGGMERLSNLRDSDNRGVAQEMEKLGDLREARPRRR